MEEMKEENKIVNNEDAEQNQLQTSDNMKRH